MPTNCPIRQAIADKVAVLMEAGAVLDPGWITQGIIQDHSEGLSGDESSDLWRACGYVAIRDQARRYLNKMNGLSPDKEPVAQMLLPGFAHVRRYYPVIRDGQEQHVPSVDLTDEEIDAKVSELRGMGRACFQHADELGRFKARRGLKHAAE